DLGVRKALEPGAAPLPAVREVLRRAEAWRPFRAYAVLHLWTALGDPHADDDRDRLPARAAAPDRRRRRADRRLPAGPAGARGGGRAGSWSAGARADRRAARRVLRRGAP